MCLYLLRLRRVGFVKKPVGGQSFSDRGAGGATAVSGCCSGESNPPTPGKSNPGSTSVSLSSDMSEGRHSRQTYCKYWHIALAALAFLFVELAL